MFSQTTVYTNRAGDVTPTLHNYLPHTVPSAQRGTQATAQGHISLLCLCKWSGQQHVAVSPVSVTSDSPALTLVLCALCLTGWEEAQRPLWRKRLQRRLSMFPREGCQGKSYTVTSAPDNFDLTSLSFCLDLPWTSVWTDSSFSVRKTVIMYDAF